MPATSLVPIPAPLLYSLLKAIDPGKALKGQFKAEKGAKISAGAKRSFTGALEAASQAKSAKQFESLMETGPVSSLSAGCGAITTLTVSYSKKGYTTVVVSFENYQNPGCGTIVSTFPTT
ncbi:MAG: hypothetical protein JO093_11010 [Acidobacteria bacterium]|nr:hypothetical protein [Acidobacteriota bacterium]MBV9067951.1 hypothetical protein [Acidobacteriota bacterium]MBV9186147.1 hypothetical protein [Acidobacteriota bacterium]